METLITIQVGKVQEDTVVNRELLGNFIEHLGRCIENGIWMYDETSRPLFSQAPLERVPIDLLDALKGIKIPVLRWPGGCFSDTYHWNDGIGPRDQRPLRKNRAWGGIKSVLGKIGPDERNHFGTDEFLALCNLLGAEPYINVNYGSGTPEEAGRWVEHCVGRGVTGKTWGIANEIFGYWETGHEKDPAAYGRGYLEFAGAIKQADPTAKLVAVGWINHSAWNRALLETIKGNVDFLSLHMYYTPKSLLRFMLGSRGFPATETAFYTELNTVMAYERAIEAAQADIDAVYGPGEIPSKPKIAFDEWNVWSTWHQVYLADRPPYRLVDALWCALVLNCFIRHTKSVAMANYAQLVNTIGLILSYEDAIVLTPSYHVFKLYSDALFPRQVDVVCNCGTITSRGESKAFPAETAAVVDVAAMASVDGTALSLFVVNKDFAKAQHLQLDLRAFGAFMGTIRFASLDHEDPFSANTRDAPETIVPVEWTKEAGSFDGIVEIAAHSIVVIRMDIDTGGTL